MGLTRRFFGVARSGHRAGAFRGVAGGTAQLPQARYVGDGGAQEIVVRRGAWESGRKGDEAERGSVLAHQDFKIWPSGGCYRCGGIRARMATRCRNGSKGVLDRDPGGESKSRLWLVGAVRRRAASGS